MTTSNDDDGDRLHDELARLRALAASLEMRAARAEEEVRACRAVHGELVEGRTRAVDALLQSEEKLRLAADAAGIGFWSWDIAADRVEWSEVLCRIWGVDYAQVPMDRRAYMDRVHPDDRDRSRARIARGVDERAWSDEFRILRGHDGATRWVSSFARVMRVGDREVALGAILDVTERRERDERLRQSQKLEAVGLLTAGISHNFNNMLMGILPNLEIAERRAPPEILPLLQTAGQSAQRAAELVRQLVTFSGRARHASPVVEYVGPIIERSVMLCRTTFDQRIALETNLDGQARAQLDAAQLQQAVLNVLLNARDAVADVATPRVAIDVSLVLHGATELEGRPGEFVRVRVRDNGAGIDAATMEHLYEPFFTTKAPGKGTGLGLATTRGIVHEHGGFLACTSAPGRGTTLAMYLPSESAPAHTPAPPASPLDTRGSETLLIVDDEPAIRRAVATILRDAGFDPRQAGSGEEALALLDDARLVARLRLVLLDVSMPGMPSSELRTRIAAIAPDARIVYFTGYAYDAADTADAVLQKPVTREELLAAVREVLDRPRAAERRSSRVPAKARG
jgi:PAS domain S-box-containing protein